MSEINYEQQLELISGLKIKLNPETFDDITITPIAEIDFDQPMDGNHIPRKICRDIDTYLDKKNGLVLKNGKKCSNKSCRKTVEQFFAKKEFNPYFVSCVTHWGFLERSSSFNGTVITDMTADEKIAWACANTEYTPTVGEDDSFICHGSDQYCIRIRNLGDYGYIALDLKTLDIVLTSRIWDTKPLNRDTVAFVHPKAYTFLKSHKLLSHNVVKDSKDTFATYYNKIHYLAIKNIWYPIKYMGTKQKVSFEQMKNAFEELTDMISKKTDNVYCCSHLEFIQKSNGIGQMCSTYDHVHQGLIVDVENQTVEFGINKITDVCKSLHHDTVEYENKGKCPITNENLLHLFTKTGMDKIIFREPLDDDREAVVMARFNRTMYVCTKLRPDLVKNFDKYKKQTSKTDWASVPMSDLWC